MATSSNSRDSGASYPPPKRIMVTSCGGGIQVKLETEKPEATPEEEDNNNNEGPSPPSEPTPPNIKGDAEIPKDGYFETELETKAASFTITDEEWSSITPRKMPSGGRLLTGPWAHILSKHLRESNPYCSFAFHYNRLKTENSRKRMAPFFKAIGMCKIKECSVTVRLLITGTNESKRLVDVSYSGTLKHRVPAPWKTDHVKSEKRRGMLLLGLSADSETEQQMGNLTHETTPERSKGSEQTPLTDLTKVNVNFSTFN